MEFDFALKNRTEYLRLKNLVNNLSQNQWETRVSENWTIGNLLCHIAFWDKMTYERLTSWKKTGKAASTPDMETVDAINSSVLHLSSLLNLEKAISFILVNSEQVDNFVSELSADDINFLKESGRERWFMRHIHRSLHLDKIESVL